jgi:antitoxin component of MazEF toxin-antitoxin module
MGMVKLRRQGSSFVVTIPAADVQRLGLRAGDLIDIEIRHARKADLRAAFGTEMAQGQDALRYLADHRHGEISGMASLRQGTGFVSTAIAVRSRARGSSQARTAKRMV